MFAGFPNQSPLPTMICFSLGLDKVETGNNFLMELNALTKCLIVYIHTGLLALSFNLMSGATLS